MSASGVGAPGPVLLTGGAGYIGRHTAHRLSSLGYSVTVVDDVSAPSSTIGVRFLRRLGITTHRCDVTAPNALVPLLATHPIVLHMASPVGVRETMGHAARTLGQLRAALAMAEQLTSDHAVLFTSSSEIYGLHSLLYHGQPMREDNLTVYEPPSNPRWHYARTKGLTESLLAATRGKTISVRVFNAYGPALDYPNPRRVIPIFASRLANGEPLLVGGDGSQRRSYCFVSDLVSGIVLALHQILVSPPGTHEVVNLGNPAGASSVLYLANEMVDLALDVGLLRKRVPILADQSLYEHRFNDTWHREVDISKAAAMLGYQPQVPLRDGLRRVLEFYRRVRVGADPEIEEEVLECPA